MKKYVIIIIICFLGIGIVSYIISQDEKDEGIPASEYLKTAEEHLTKHEYSKALEQYKFAINADPSNTEAYLKASEIYILKGRRKEAVEILKNGENSASSPDMIHYTIGTILFEDKDYQAALEYFEHAFNENQNNWENVIALVKAYSYFPDKETASIKSLKKLDTQNPDASAWKSYYLALLSYEDSSEMISYLQTPNTEAEAHIKQKTANLKEIGEKIKSDPDDIVQNNTLISYEFINEGLYNYAIPLLEEVVSENDEYYAAYMYLGICHLNLDNRDKARENFERSTTIDPEQAQPWLFLAQVYAQQNNQKEAIDTYEEVLNIDKDNEDIRYDYAKTLVSFGLYSQARLEYKELLKLETEKLIEYKLELVYIDLDYLKEYEEALLLMKEVVDDWEGFQGADDVLKARSLDLLGWAYKANKQKDEALKYLKQSKEAYPYLPDTYYHLGIIYYEIGDTDQAILNFEKAIDLDTTGDISPKASTEIENITNESKDQSNDI